MDIAFINRDSGRVVGGEAHRFTAVLTRGRTAFVFCVDEEAGTAHAGGIINGEGTIFSVSMSIEEMIYRLGCPLSSVV